MKPATTIAIGVFCLVALAHLLRIVFGLEFTVGNVTVPVWASVLGILIPAALAIGLYKERQG